MRRKRSRLPVSSQVLLNAGGAPQGGDISAGDQKNTFRHICDEAAGGVEAGRIIHDDVAIVGDQHIEEADKLGGGGFDGAGVLVPARSCRPPLWRVMKLSSRELSMR